MTTRNSNSRFDLAPQVKTERSTFDMSFDVKTSFDVGRLVPFALIEVLPGDSFKIQTSKVMRLQTLITPVMDNLYLDTYYFFVPNRLVWSHWEDFIGGTFTESGWQKPIDYKVPEIIPPMDAVDDFGWHTGTIADYFGVPVGITDDTQDFGINALPFRAYAKIVDDWFRDENLQDPLYIYDGDSSTNGTNLDDNSPEQYSTGGYPFIAAKFHDYFTSALPKPQKGPDVSFLDGFVRVLPEITSSSYDTLPVLDYRDVKTNTIVKSMSTGQEIANGRVLGGTTSGNVSGKLSAGSVDDIEHVGQGLIAGFPIYFDNLFADLSKAIVPGGSSGFSTTSINTLRQAFQIQRMLERDARGGTRYIEILKAHFGVTSPDSRLQRAEYLGGNRVPFNIEQVLQTSSTDNTTPQGNVAGWSQTNDTSYDVEKSFVEHGFIIGVMCARYDHSYQQGLERMFFRSGRFDYYWPVLAHIGEKPVFKCELYWTGRNHLVNNSYGVGYNYPVSVFGYQEAWAEYRYKPNYITGQMRSSYRESLDFWHFGDVYEEVPTLSADWIREDKANVDRTLAVQSSVSNQIFGDIFVKCTATRPLPLYSIPGMIDHF